MPVLKYFFSARYWSTSAIFSQGSRNLLISNNEVTRSMGNGIMIKSESLSKDYWSQQVRNISRLEFQCICISMV